MDRSLVHARMLALALVACGGTSSPRPTAPASTGSQTDGAQADAAAAPVVAIPEIEARVILAEMFRAAGYRILYDVPVPLGAKTVAIDGYDPDARLGFEYRAAAEAAVWSGKLPAGVDVKILVIDATDRDSVEARAKAFLAGLKASSSGSDR